MYDYVIRETRHTSMHTITHTLMLRPVTSSHLRWKCLTTLVSAFPHGPVPQINRKEQPSCERVHRTHFWTLWTICFHDVKQASREAADAPCGHSYQSFKRRGQWERWWVVLERNVFKIHLQNTMSERSQEPRRRQWTKRVGQNFENIQKHVKSKS